MKRECRVAGLCGSDIAADEDWSQSHMRIDNPRMQFFALCFRQRNALNHRGGRG